MLRRFFVLSRVRARLTYANLVATLALFIALGGSSYAALNLPKNSVKARQIAKNAVGSSEIKARAVRTSEVRDGSLLAGDFAAGQLPAGAKGDKGDKGESGPRGPSDGYEATGAIPLSKSVPAGNYFVVGKVVRAGGTAGTTRCDINADAATEDAAFGATEATGATQETLNPVGLVHFDAPGTISLVCGGTPTTSSAHLIVVKVETLN
jgi:hypothetical protein